MRKISFLLLIGLMAGLLGGCGSNASSLATEVPTPTQSASSNITITAPTPTPTIARPTQTPHPTTMPATTSSATVSVTQSPVASSQPSKTTGIPTLVTASSTDYNVTAIKKALAGVPGNTSCLVILPDGKSTVEDDADKQLPSASTIKLWIVATIFDEAKNGTLDMSEKYTVKAGDIASGTGILSSKVGQTFSITELVTTTLIYSDNSGANILINKLGGFDKVNTYASDHGYTKTKLQRKLGFLDPSHENYTDARDAAAFMQRLIAHQIVDADSSDTILQALDDRLSYQQDQNFFGSKLDPNVNYRHISGTGTQVRNEIGYIEIGGNAPLIIAIFSSGTTETSEETGIENAVQQIYTAVKS